MKITIETDSSKVEKKRKYFAYGSNMNPKRMKDRDVSFYKRVHANIRGYRLEFNIVANCVPRKGYANIICAEEAVVEGALYEILDSDLPKLDKCEGHPKQYYRIEIQVRLENGQKDRATIYIAQPDKVKEGLEPTKSYLAHLLAAKDILPKPYYDKLESWDTLD